MATSREYLIEHDVRNSTRPRLGYHIAEQGANPISQLAFTARQRASLLSRIPGPRHEDRRFPPNLSFSSATAWSPEMTRCWRAGARIWAIAMRDKYAANERSQKLKFHSQTSGRSLHAQEIGASTTSAPHDRR